MNLLDLFEAKDRFSYDRDDEAMRRLEAYLKKEKIDWRSQEWRNSDRAAVDAHIAANPSRYPIPQTDNAYLYHGTAKARLPAIARQGLAPQDKTRWGKDGLAWNAVGRVFFADTVRKALFYAEQASKTRPVLLRVRRQDIRALQPDVGETEGSFFTTTTIPPRQIEYWNGQRWMPLVKV